MNILEEKNNPLFHRKELIIQIESPKTPSKVEVTKQIAEKTKSSEENIIVEKIDSNFGSQTFKVTALVYESKESKEKYTIITAKARKKQAEEAKKAEEEAKKEEAKKTEEEAKPEEEPKSEVKEEIAIPDKEPTAESKPEVKEE